MVRVSFWKDTAADDADTEAAAAGVQGGATQPDAGGASSFTELQTAAAAPVAAPVAVMPVMAVPVMAVPVMAVLA